MRPHQGMILAKTAEMKPQILLLAVAASSFTLGVRSAAQCDDTLNARVASALPTVDALSKAVMGEVTYLEVASRPAFLIRPQAEKPSTPMPWVWYAPTIGGQPRPAHAWMFRQFLAKGIAIAGIYTVCDMSSWPGLKRASGAYEMSEQELAAVLQKHNPIDRLAPLAAAGIPILHIHGDSDKPVPLERNAGELARRYRKLGGKIKLIVVPGKGHEEATEIFQCQPLVDLVIENAGPAARAGGLVP